MNETIQLVRITDWSAKRSGASITVTGRGPAGAPRTIPLIAEIRRIDGLVVATGVSGVRYELV